jgi:hypothetical protein
MWRTLCNSALALAAALSLASCGTSSKLGFVSNHEPWRKDLEVSCLRAGVVQDTAFIAGGTSISGGDGYCGAVKPYKVSAVGNGQVGLTPNAVVQCQMIPALDRWVDQVVIPAAHAVYGVGIAQMKVLSSYSCRPMNNVQGAKLSEHGHANAVDIGSFMLTNGRTVTVLAGWNGSDADRRFLRAVHDGACDTFSTVLGPMANAQHRDHFHVDLMPRHAGKGVCR